MTRAILFIVALGAFGCDRAEGTPRDTRPAQGAPKDDTAAPADNTRKNERDRDMSTPTPGDQKENDVDRGITQKIRQTVVKNDGLSMTAKNVKIITQDGVVTLRGVVKSEKEKQTIGDLAQKTEGVSRVDNQLEIKAD
jgi:osmotically-inducible protein OsmY